MNSEIWRAFGILPCEVLGVACWEVVRDGVRLGLANTERAAIDIARAIQRREGGIILTWSDVAF